MSDDAVARGRELVWRLGEAACVTFARGDSGEVISAFGGDPAEASTMTIEESVVALSGHHYSAVPSAVLVRGVGGWQVAVEVNGFEGSRFEVLRALCVHGPAVSVFWGLHGSHFSYAIDGRTAVRFEMSEPDAKRGRDPHALDAYLAGLPFVAGVDGLAAGFALAERITGVRLPLDILDVPYRRALLTPVPDDLVHESHLDDPALDDPFIQELIAAPTPDKLPRIAHRIAQMIAADSGLANEPLIQEVLAVLAAGAPAADDLRERLFARAQAPMAISQDLGRDMGQRRAATQEMSAVATIATQLGPDPAPHRRMPNQYSLVDRARWPEYAILKRCRDRARNGPPARL